MSRLPLLLLALSLTWAQPAPSSEIDPLVLGARVWGLAKYHHPQLVACAVDWDAELLARWDVLEAAGVDDIGAALAGLLAAAGETPRASLDAGTPDWIAAAPLSLPMREQLAWLAAQRPQSQCKVTAFPNTGQADFDGDQAHATRYPDRPHRALAAFRYWNAIEYFFPYKSDIGRDWGEVLQQHLPQILLADPDRGFAIAMRRFTAEINDSHAGMSHPGAAADFGAGFPPVSLRPVEGRTVVVTVADGDWGVAVGDEVLEIDDEPIAERLARLDARAFGSNPAWRATRVHQLLGTGPDSPASFLLQRPDGIRYAVELPRANGWPIGVELPPTWRRETLDSCSIGVVDLARLQQEEIDAMFDDLGDTDALLFDVRNYPNGVMWDLVDRLFDAPAAVARLTRPRLDQPGTFEETLISLGGRLPNGYDGRILLLQNEASISQSEYTLMGLQADGRAISFGSQTAGADGNITRIHTPGDQLHTITGLGVFYPDGRSTQRIGIVPDVHVAPTIEGVVDGRDEVLQAALDCRWIAGHPGKRTPAQGLYYAPERSGEGIDIQQNAGGTTAMLSYGFDDDGNPEWWLATEDESGPSPFLRYSRDGATAAVPAAALDFHRGPYHPECAIADQSRLHPRASWTWPAGDDNASACVVPLLTGAGTASGMWAGSGDESGWGVSIHHVGDRVTVVAYAYDEEGEPRWLLGNTAWDGQMPIEVPLSKFRGFCRQCAPSALEIVGAGSLVLQLASDGAPAGASWLSIDAAFDDAVRWHREQMPIRRITDPDSTGAVAPE